jgi:arylsulfatase
MNKKSFKRIIFLFAATLILLASCTSNEGKVEEPVKVESASTGPDRTVLPFALPAYNGKIDSFYTTSTPDWNQVKAPEAPNGAPNVLLIVLDDVGFGQLGSYGGAIETPNLDKLANTGLQYTNFHTTALCSPTRGALLTGRNHHAVGLAAITEAATGYPGNFGTMPKNAAFISETLKHNGYNTIALGKWHLAPYTAYTAAGPFSHWPLGQGFERFYGFVGGETDQWAPLLAQDNQFLEIPNREGYFLTEDLVDKTIAYIADQQQANTGRPFFTYLALGATHAPLHAPKKNIDKYKGRFDKGWDLVRQEIFDRQKRMGVIPANAVLPSRNQGVQAWDELSETQKKVYTRLQEVFAGFLDHADEHIGRLMAAIDDMGIRENTMIIVVSDNGASQEGGKDGTFNTDRYRNYNPDNAEEMIKKIDKLGSHESDPHYPIGWSMAGNTPFKRWKQDTHAGGNTDPFIINWPAKIKQGGKRNQYHHVIDIVPTILEAASLPAPKMVNGIEQQALHGVSMIYTMSNADAPSIHTQQYYEMLGSRAMYKEGWKAVVNHVKGEPWSADKWELYHVAEDVTESNDLAIREPAKLKELQDLWWVEAKKYNVLPLDDRRYERQADPTRPVASRSMDIYTYYPGTSTVHPLAMPNLQSQKAHTITAYANVPNANSQGVLACSGTEFGGWTLFIQGGKLHYVHNYLAIQEFEVSSNVKVTPGDHKFSMHWIKREDHLKPDYFRGDVELYIDEKLVGTTKDVLMAGQYGIAVGYGLLIGRNTGTTVSHKYKAPFAYSGKLKKVTIELK